MNATSRGRSVAPFVLGGLAVCVAAYAVHLLFGQGRHGLDGFFNDWVQNALLLSGGLIASVGAATHPRGGRTPWVVLSVALFTWATGGILWSAIFSRMPEPPYPSITDALWLAVYPMVYVVLVLLVRQRVTHFHASVWLDGLIGALALGALGAGILWPSLEHAAEGNALVILVNFAYPIVDVLLLAILAGVFGLTRGRPGRTFLLLSAGLVLNTVADSINLVHIANGGGDGQSILDVVWAVAVLTVSFAAWQPSGEPDAMRLDGGRVLAAPAVFAVIAIGVIAWGVVGDGAMVPTLLALATLVAVMIRAGLTFRENLLLLDVHRQARTDHLTGLLNRRGFYQRSEELLAALGPDERTALLLLDLDRFKELNDALGHHAGDDLLCQIATRLPAALPAGSLVGRLGGDEFVALLPAGHDADGAVDAARGILDALDEPFVLEDLRTPAAGSIGIALYPEHAHTRDALMRSADVAMYRAKQLSSGIRVYEATRDHHSRDRFELLTDLQGALEQDQILLHYQPQAELATGEVLAVEALARWEHPTRGLLYPDAFIALAEEHGLMRRLTLHVLELALRRQQEWRAAGRTFTVAVNLSPANLLDVRFPDDVTTLLDRYDVPPGALQLEITENTVMTDPVRALDILARLSGRGIAFSLDDFGTGYSSLAYLKRLPITELKIDRSFVMEMTSDEDDAAIVRSTVELARNLGLSVVAEGVETKEHWDRLSGYGCTMAQGYFLSRPLPADALLTWLDGVEPRTVDAHVSRRAGAPVRAV